MSRETLLSLLADGDPHSGAELGRMLGVTRAAVHKQLARLRAEGLPIQVARGAGYALDPRFRPLDGARLATALADLPVAVTVLSAVDSTNRFLGREALAGRALAGRVIFAEQQSAGRGREGRAWHATPYGSLLLSMGWAFERTVTELAGLSLAVGVAVHEVAYRAGAHDLAIKWPNDLVSARGKVGGILLEIRGESEAPAVVLCGIGLNVTLADAERTAIDQPAVSLAELAAVPIDRTALAIDLVRTLVGTFRRFGEQGLVPFRSAFDALHRDRGASVVLRFADGRTVTGTVAGVDDRGGLRLVTAEGREQVFYAGEVSLRRESVA